MSKLDTAHGPYVDLMGLGRVFVVPDYQRPYSWKAKKQVAELWSDILRLYRNLVDNDKQDTHFIGSVVIGQASTKALGPVECPVIDGQQRLITLSLIIAAIRDVLVKDADDRAQITAQYLAHFKGDDIAAVRVRPGNDDRASFDAIIRQDDATDAKGSVRRAYQYVVERLEHGPIEDEDPDEPLDEYSVEDSEEPEDPEEEFDETGTVQWSWQSLLAVVGTQLELVSISDVAPENAYQIFATLNSTGLPLSQVDLTRNAVFMLMPKAGAKAHKDLWVPMEIAMGKDLLQSYLHTWVIRRGHNVPAKEIYSSAIREFSKAGNNEADVRKALKELHSAAPTYLRITRPNVNVDANLGPEPKVGKPIRSSLRRLREWGTVPMEPVLMEILERYRSKQLTAPQVLKLLLYLESFVVRRFIVQVPPNDLRSSFARLTQQIRTKTTGAAFEKAITDGLLEKMRRWPTDPEVVDAFQRRPLYRSPGQRQSFFILKRIAEKYEGKESPQIVYGTAADDYSIEHILPQSFPDEWRDDLIAWKDPKPQETWETRLHVAGNLTLTAYNSELAAMRFSNPTAKMDKKRWIEANLKLEMSKGIVTKKKWTRIEIDARSLDMATKARAVWPIP